MDMNWAGYFKLEVKKDKKESGEANASPLFRSLLSTYFT
jgi:hypothetical protein